MRAYKLQACNYFHVLKNGSNKDVGPVYNMPEICIYIRYCYRILSGWGRAQMPPYAP
jgi:hypothetical protein